MYNLVFACIFLAVPVFAQVATTTHVDVNLNVKHITGNTSVFDREKYITLHAGLTDGDWDSDAQREQFLTDYDVYLGRNNGSLPWNLSQANEDPSRPGWADVTHMQQRGADARSSFASKTSAHALESRATGLMIGGQPSMYPNGQLNGKGWAIADYDALGEYFSNFLTHFYGTGGSDGETKPTVIEVMNEPFVHANELGTTRANISELHRVVANRIKQDHPEVLVGGYTAAHPQYEGGNFKHWNDNWKTYIDTAGAVTDFYSLHLYDNHQSVSDPSEVMYRSGSNVEAILDMVEHYSWLKLGEVKPFNISEFGALPQNGDQPYSRQTDWENLSAYSKMQMQLLERSNNVMKSMPFMILKAEWGRNPVSGNPYTSRLLRQKFEVEGESGDAWVYTDLIKFYQLWSEVAGTRVDTQSNDPDIQVDTYVDGKVAYVILNSLDHTASRTIDLAILGAQAGSALQQMSIKHLYANAEGVAELDEYSVDTATLANDEVVQLTVGASATMILKCTYANALTIDQTAKERKYYANTYLQPIASNTAINFSIQNVARSTAQGEAVLRLGLGRAHGLSLKPTLLVNGYAVDVPDNWRGYDQSSRSSFFGVLEIPVPYAYLKWNNSVQVQFPDGGGHVSSVSLQVFEFSTDIPRHASQVVEGIEADELSLYTGVTTVSVGGQHRPLVYVGPQDAVDPQLIWSSSDASIATVSPSGVVTGMSVGSATISVRSVDGSLMDQYTITVGSSGPLFRLDDYAAYQAQTYVAGSTMDVRTIYDAGAGNEVSNVKGGIRYMLREMTSNWQVVKDYVVDDSSAIGTQCGASVASIPLPGAMLPSAELPAGNFYFLFVSLNAEDVTANASVAVSQIQVVRSTPVFEFDDVAAYKEQDYIAGQQLDVTTFYDAGSGYTVTAKEGGVRYMLREVTSDWKVVQDYVAVDTSVVGTHSGVSRASIALPGDMPASDQLPSGNFYFLFALFETKHPDAGGKNMAIGLSPITIVQSVSSLQFDDPNQYRSQSYTVGSTLPVTTYYDAGSGYSVTAAEGGIRYMLREVTSSWKVVNDYVAIDAQPFGEQAGVSSASIILPPDMVPSDALPAGNFYFLFALMGTEDPSAQNGKRSVGVSPISIQAR